MDRLSNDEMEKILAGTGAGCYPPEPTEEPDPDGTTRLLFLGSGIW